MNQKNKADYWQIHIDKARDFSGSQKKYCLQENLNHHTFQYWKKKLNAKKPLTGKSSSFAPVFITGSEFKKPIQASSLPDPKWLAEFLLNLQAIGAQR